MEDLLHPTELSQVVLDLNVELLYLILVHLLSGLLTLYILHSHLVIIIKHLQLSLDGLLLFEQLVLPLQQLPWLLLELAEDHRGVNHVLYSGRES